MRIEAEVEAPGGKVKVILRGEDAERIWGKFVFGRLERDPGQRILVFDDSAEFHKQIASAYGVKASGGGWIEIDRSNRTALVGGRSTQYGREADRGLTVALLGGALPDIYVEAG